MKKRHLSIVGNTHKPVAPSKRTERVFCYKCNEYPTRTRVEIGCPEQNAKGEWLTSKGVKLLVCKKCDSILKQKNPR